MNNMKKWSAEKMSMRVFYVLTALCIAVFALFWLVGYERPFTDNPNFNAPLFTDAVIVLGYLITATGVGISLWAVVRALKIRGRGESYDNNIAVKKISYSITIGVLGLLLLTFIAGSSAEMTINGIPFTNQFWLKMSDMFIYTSLILMGVAIGTVIYGASKYTRRK